MKCDIEGIIIFNSMSESVNYFKKSMWNQHKSHHTAL